ncbi:hypothetical protein Lfu02_75940 [Longispora fulva]|uniref:DNA-binding SARP family transcriptional activator n=1 Tax=Longispora fulva TaxID=619741 RepID=A0A8J7GCU1_9ACTN|nr:BTAD domain-containing putative transcriptional regulator [Longispora fulva]MBG6136269.1 DNA-binding SARP family transcriptional activator [Longispora fulva]GIG63222.1 hypothetical protein Lfu02_75940 [Longispora fulva]
MTRDPFRRRPLRAVGRVFRAVASLIAIAAVVAGLPMALWHFFGDPLPRSLPSTPQGWGRILTSGFDDAVVVRLLVIALWFLWAAVCYSLVAESIAALQGRGRRARRSRSPLHALASVLIAGLMAAPTITLAAGPAPAATAAVAVQEVRTVDSVGVSASHVPSAAPESAVHESAVEGLPRFAAATGDGRLTVVTSSGRHTVDVRHGDTLWDIAETWLGDGARYAEIYQLNADRYDDAGRMRGGDHIEAGWTLTLPDDATAPPDATPAPPAPSPSTHSPAPHDTPGPATAPTPQATMPQPDDGVAAQPSAPATNVTVPATASTPPTASASRDAKSGVSLPGNGWIDVGLATAIVAAAATVWIHRRRRYKPMPPVPGARDRDPDLQPLPKVVATIGRRLRTGPTLFADPARASDLDADSRLKADDASTEAAEVEPTTKIEPASPFTPSLHAGTRTIWPPAGLGLTGPGAEAAGRGMLAATLAAGAPDDPSHDSEVIIPATTLATLLGTSAVDIADTPRLTVTAGLPEALNLLEDTALHRSRLVYEHEVDDVAAVRHSDPLEEYMPPVVLIADAAEPHAKARIAALLVQGRRLDIHGILLGPWQPGDTVAVADDGTTRRAGGDVDRPGAHAADVGRVAVISPADTADLLRVLAEAHTGQLPTPAPTEDAVTATSPPVEGVPNEKEAAVHAGDGEPHASHRHDLTGTPSTVDGSVTTAMSGHAPADFVTAGAGPVRVRARVRVLGPPGVQPTVDPVEDGPGFRTQALELLVFLAANGGRATTDAIYENLLPDAPMSRAHHRVNTFATNIRKVLTRFAGPGAYLLREQHVFILAREAVDVDLWRLQDAFAHYQACAPHQTAEKIAALRIATTAFGGALAEGCRFDWVDAYREHARRLALDAHLALADLIARTDTAEAQKVITAALRLDPYAEDIYCQAMRIHALAGDIPAIRATRREVTNRLADVDTDPTDATLHLAEELITQIEHGSISSHNPAQDLE